jgi:hypothetical protein
LSIPSRALLPFPIKTFLFFQNITLTTLDGWCGSLRSPLCLFIFYLSLSLLSLHKLQGGEEREKKQRKKKKKITLKAHRNSDDDITSIVEKISIR